MIKIDRHRVDCPHKLDSSNRILRESDYNHDEVIAALSEMQHFKCCYCEKDLKPLGRTEKWVEHFVAQSDESFKDSSGNIDWNKANAWENLLYACGTCNRSKGKTPPFDSNNRRKLIDPSYDKIDPEKHIEFSINGTAISYKERNRSRLGKTTIKILKLKLEKRNDIYQALRKLQRSIDSIFDDFVNELSARDNLKANSMLRDLERMTSAHWPHASFCRKYIIQQVKKFNRNGLQALKQQFGIQIQPITVEVAKEHEVIE